MKKSVICLLAVIVAMTACNREMMEAPESNAKTVTVNAGFAGAPDTKTAIVPGDNNRFSFTWKAGDQLAVLEVIPYIATLDDPDVNYPYPGEMYFSEPLGSDATEAVFNLNLGEREYVSGDIHYVAIYPASCAVDVPNGYWDDENKKVFATIDFPKGQAPTADSFDPEADVLVSKAVVRRERPDKLSFQFARVGTIVKMVLTGLPEGAVISGGDVEFGFEAGYYFEYDPAEEKIILSDGTDGISFHYDPGLVVGEDHTATVWLRCMSGISDNIHLYLYGQKDGDSFEWERRISLRAKGTPLEFKEGGLTTFSVRLGSSDVDNPLQEDIDYHTNQNMDGVTFTWPYPNNASLAGYECILLDENDIRHYFNFTGKVDSHYEATVNSGLEPGEYTLYSRALAVEGKESQHDYLEVCDIRIGVPKRVVINKVISQYSDVDLGLELPGHEDVDTEDLYYGLTFWHRNLDWGYQCIEGIGGRTKSWALWNNTSVRIDKIIVETKSGNHTKYTVHSSDYQFLGGNPGTSPALVGSPYEGGGYAYSCNARYHFLITGTETVDISQIIIEYYK